MRLTIEKSLWATLSAFVGSSFFAFRSFFLDLRNFIGTLVDTLLSFGFSLNCGHCFPHSTTLQRNELSSRFQRSSGGLRRCEPTQTSAVSLCCRSSAYNSSDRAMPIRSL